VTSREVDVLSLVAAGLPNATIAAQLFLSPRTVETHVASLLAKTGAPGRAGLAAYAPSSVLAEADSVPRTDPPGPRREQPPPHTPAPRGGPHDHDHGARAVATTPQQLHLLFEAFVNDADADGLASLFEPDGLMVPAPASRPAAPRSCTRRAPSCAPASPGSSCAPTPSARPVTWRCSAAPGRRHHPDGGTVGGRTTEVLRRQPDGRWLAVIDHPNWIA
jgi:DNA-binding CsgD family transcriptional regulator/ketosteroid isomerase-like protein